MTTTTFLPVTTADSCEVEEEKEAVGSRDARVGNYSRLHKFLPSIFKRTGTCTVHEKTCTSPSEAFACLELARGR